MKIRRVGILLILNFLLVTNVISSIAAEPPAPTVIQNILYVPNGDSLQVMDLTLPGKGDGTFPVILAIHGGGGDKTEFNAWAKYFAELGFATVSINFRGMPDRDMLPEKSLYPASVKDAFCALAWIGSNANTYRFDLQRVAALGFSLGGTLAAMLGTVDDRTPYLKDCPYTLTDQLNLKSVITVSAIFDYRLPMNPGVEQYSSAYLGAGRESNSQLWANASPINYVSGNEPPFLLLHGQSDRSIDVNQPNAFVSVLQKMNGNVILKFLPGGHMAVIRNPEAYQIAGDFLSKIFK
jgi:acetyl esterase/lipase